MFDFKDKTAIVTGASRGIGRTVANYFARAGANLVLIDVNENGLQDCFDEINKNFNNIEVFIFKCDVSDSNEVIKVIEKSLEKLKTIDFLINNAGIVFRKKIEEIEIAEWDRMMNINVLGVLNLCKAVIPVMKKQGKGKIINASSNMANIPDVGMAAYCVSKASIDIITKVLASELAPYGINVNAYSPGIIETEMTEDLIKSRGEQKLKYISLNKFGKADDVAKLVLFLSSDLSDYITGTIVPVDGGLLSTQNPWMAWDSIKNNN